MSCCRNMDIMEAILKNRLDKGERFSITMTSSAQTLSVNTDNHGRATCFIVQDPFDLEKWCYGKMTDSLLYQLGIEPLFPEPVAGPEPVKRYTLDGVIYREYEWIYDDDDEAEYIRIYRIDDPVAFYWAPGHTTHRVLDKNGTVHIVPAPGEKGCVLRYAKAYGEDPVRF